jgi:hypothetical protein
MFMRDRVGPPLFAADIGRSRHVDRHPITGLYFLAPLDAIYTGV